MAMIPKTYKGLLKLLIAIAHNGNDFKGGDKMTEEEDLEIGAMIAGIQNDLGEAEKLLEKFKLKYNG